MNIFKNTILISALVISSQGSYAHNPSTGNIYVWSGGKVVYKEKANVLEDIRLSDDKSTITLLDAEKQVMYSAAYSAIDSIGFTPVLPKADILDIEFFGDGSAVDNSPMKNAVTYHAGSLVRPCWNYDLQRVGVRSKAAWGGNDQTSGYYSINLAPIFDKLADGYSVEAIVMTNQKNEGKEAKWFSCHQGGGPGGLMVTGQSKLAFLVNTTGSGYAWGAECDYDINQYYHVVGIYSKAEQKVYLYVDGKLMATTNALGDLTRPGSDQSQWWAIMGDPQDGKVDQQMPGEIYSIRMYDKTLSPIEVEMLYESVKLYPEVMPKADILDVKFCSNGSALDASPMWNSVATYANSTLSTYWNNEYGCYAARSTSPWNAANTGHYRIPLTDDMFNKLSDGYTMEAIVMTPEKVAKTEAKWIACHQGGGPGAIMVSSDNRLTFLPNTSTTGYCWGAQTNYNINQYYHVVGVYNKSESKTYLYVDGELKATATAQGNLTRPGTNKSYFWAIFGDPQDGEMNQCIPGDVVTFRLYDKPFAQSDVDMLWDNIHPSGSTETSARLVTGINYVSDVHIKSGGKFEIYGTGYEEGDQVRFTSCTNSNRVYYTYGYISEYGYIVNMPYDIVADTYSMTLIRNNEYQRLGNVTFDKVVTSMPSRANVIAHRGYWSKYGSAQNSRASLQFAQDLNVYGSETDVWLTTDNVLMVNHDASYSGVTIQNSTYNQCKDLTLSNGEKMPRLEDLLQMTKDNPSSTKLIIEIKGHSTTARNQAAAAKAVELVDKYGVADKVEYISFNWDACLKVISLRPNAKVAYLDASKTPQQLKNAGFTGLDYEQGSMRNNSGWFNDAHNLGLTVNVWTLRSHADIVDMIDRGADYLTTDMPEHARNVKRHYDINQ
ncbi:MAG: LamG-like jellyroll fold domain-containing protein [Muribaculaceae bacterium]